jgi:signal transduction histidine kinase
MATMTLDDLQRIARVMKKSSANLYTLLGNLLEWSSMQRGLIAFNPLSITLRPKVNDILLSTFESANNKEITIKNTIPGDLEVYADENILSSIFRNLVANAVKFTNKSGTITIAAQPISNSLVEITVKDTGIGMSSDLIENLFNFDVNTSRKGTDGELSTGLGLMICKDFVEKHGGELRIESEEGKGSTFRFTIPSKTSL